MLWYNAHCTLQCTVKNMEWSHISCLCLTRKIFVLDNICLTYRFEPTDLNNYLPKSILHGKRFKQREYLQQMMQVWLYIVPANIQHILFRFGVNLQGFFHYPFWWSSLILSLMIIYDHFLMIIFVDHLWSPLRATLLNSLEPSAPKSPSAVFTFSNNSSSTFSS